MPTVSGNLATNKITLQAHGPVDTGNLVMEVKDSAFTMSMGTDILMTVAPEGIDVLTGETDTGSTLTISRDTVIDGTLHVNGVASSSTAAAGTNTTQLATTAFVHGAVADSKVSPSFTGTVNVADIAVASSLSSTVDTVVELNNASLAKIAVSENVDLTGSVGIDGSTLAIQGRPTIQGDLAVSGDIYVGGTIHTGMKASVADVLNSTGLMPYGTVIPDSTDVFDLPSRFFDGNSYRAGGYDAASIYDVCKDTNVDIMKNGKVVNYGSRASGPTSYVLSYGSSNVYAPTWTHISSSNIDAAYASIYENAPKTLPVTLRYSSANPDEVSVTPSELLSFVKPVFGYYIDKGYNMPIPDYGDAFLHMYGTGSPNEGVIGIEFGYDSSSNSTIPNNVYLSYAPYATAGSASYQSGMYNGGFMITNKAHATNENLYVNPATIPVTTDASGFAAVYGTTGACALYDPVKSHIHIYFKGSSTTTSTGATSAEFNASTDGIGITWNEKFDFTYFSGSFAILKKRADVTSMERPFAPATSFDKESFLVQISPNVSYKWTPYQNNGPSAITAPVDISYPAYTSENKYQGLVFSKVGNGKASYDIMCYYFPDANALEIRTIIPIVGDNPYTKNVENVSTASSFLLWNNDIVASFMLSCDYNNVFTDTPESLAANMLPSHLHIDATKTFDVLTTHELSHSVRDINNGMFPNAGNASYINTEGHATSCELQRCKIVGELSVWRSDEWSMYNRNLFRGAWTVEKRHHKYPGELHAGYSTQSGRVRGSFFAQYGESMLYNYIIENYDANAQIERYVVDLVAKDMTDTLTLANYPLQTSLVVISPKLAQNKLDYALQSLTANYGAPVSLSTVFVDFCVSAALLRNNAAIPDKYKSKHPYWFLNRHAPHWSAVTSNCDQGIDSVFWSDAVEGVPMGSWPIMTSRGWGYGALGDTIHPIWPKVGSTFSNGLDRNLLGSWANPATMDAFTYTTTSYIADPLVHQVEDLSCISYVIPTTNGGSTVYGTSHYIDNVAVSVTKGDWVFKVVQYVPGSGSNGQFIQNFHVSTDGGATYTSVDEYAINVTDSSYDPTTDSWSVGTAHNIKIKFDTFNTNCHGTNWHGVDVYYFPRLVCVHRKNHVYNRYRSIYPPKCIYSGYMTLQANVV